MNKLLELTPEELAKVQRARAKHESSKTKVSPEEMIVAEFGYYYGWQGIQAILKNEISIEDTVTLIAGARKVWSAKMIDTAMAMYVAAASAQSGKKAKQSMEKGLKEFIKNAKADL